MKYISFLLTTLSVIFSFAVQAQTKTLPLNDGANLKIYQIEPTTKNGSETTAKVAVSYNKGSNDPIFGMMWVQGNVVENGNQIQLQNLKITDIKIPQLDDQAEESVKNQIIANAAKLNFSMQKNQFDNSLELYQKETSLSKGIQNTVPKIIYTKKPSILVLVDGEPNYQLNDQLGVKLVSNSPFAIVQNTDGKHYIYGGKHWYVANSLKGNYTITTNLPSKISEVESSLKKIQQDTEAQEFEEYDENTIYDIIVSTEPAELIQSSGEANFSPVTGTNLLYVDNSDDDIFMDINTQQYYTLLAGRWYSSNSLNANWKYISSENLPKDFGEIIEGSSKDNVLASVAGTEAAKEAVLDAQIPQTAKVSRSSNATIEYDGNPKFENIEGTSLQYAVNTPTSVIKHQGRYYAVEDGIWYVSNSAQGPWNVATDRPEEVSYIPASSPVYNVKYVYIYDITPDYVYMGYTPGYLNTFIYGSTVVYGTGYYYRPWIGNHYYARPYTWGFGIRYNPWYGYGFGFNYYSGWFYNPWRYHRSSWWGPSLYRPSYVYRPNYYRGQMVRSGYYSNRYYNNYRTQINDGIRNNNIYNGRRNVVTMDRGRIVNPGGNNGRITRSPRTVERNVVRNQNPNAGNSQRFDRGDRNNMVRRDGVVPSGRDRIDRSYRNNENGTVNRNQSINRTRGQGEISNRSNVTQNRNNGINREYRNNNASGGQTRTNGNIARPNRTVQNPNAQQRPQLAENNRTQQPQRINNGGIETRRPERVSTPNNNSRSTPSPNVRNNNGTQQRSSGNVSRPQNQSQNRSSGNVQRNNSSPSRQSGGSVQRSSDRPTRSTPSVNRSSGSGQSRSSATPSRSSRNDRN